MFAEDIDLLTLPLEEGDLDVSLLDLAGLGDTDSAVARFLTPRERTEYGRLGHPLRRQEWLAARVCLKTVLVRRGCVDDPIRCQIEKDERGRPWLSFQSGLPMTAVHDCSLSHKARFACACTSSLENTRVGVDIEQVSPRLAKLAHAFVNDGDSPIRTQPPEVRLAILWSLKEAYSKAVGVGLGVGFADVICEETAEGRYNVRNQDGPEFPARHFVHDGYVIGLCLMEEEACGERTGSGKSNCNICHPSP